MTKSEEWEQFSAYRPMIEDARQQEYERLLKILTKVHEAVDNDFCNNVRCETCDFQTQMGSHTICYECMLDYPCRTIREFTGEHSD